MTTPKVRVELYRVWSIELPLQQDFLEGAWMGAACESKTIMCAKCAKSLPKNIKRREKAKPEDRKQYLHKTIYCFGCSTPGYLEP